MTSISTSADFFEAKYRENGDPWNFSGSSYELARYQATVNALQHRRYRNAFEPGCSIGVLTERLASFCGHVEALDFSKTAIASAKIRCAGLRNVTLRCMSLGDRLPVTGFDLLLFSEVGYYFAAEDWAQVTTEMIGAAEPGTTVLGVHWLGTSADHCMSGDEVHTILRRNPYLRLDHEERQEHFRLDRWERV